MYTIFRNLSVNALTAPADIDRKIGAVAAKTAGLPPDALRSWRILAKSVDSRRGAPQENRPECPLTVSGISDMIER